jgi:hypothetical protein
MLIEFMKPNIRLRSGASGSGGIGPSSMTPER